MNAIATALRLQYNATRTPELVLTLAPCDMTPLNDLQAHIGKGKQLAVEIKPERIRRSLDANAYMWVILSKMAAVMHTSKDELYLLMLERYGVFTHIVVHPGAVERVMDEWRTVRNLGVVYVGGRKGVQLQVYYGSSGYSTAEMAALIDGVVDEAKEIGVETLTPEQLAMMKNEWGREGV